VASRLRVGVFKSVGAVLEAMPERLDRRLAAWGARLAMRPTSAPMRNLSENLERVLSGGNALDDALLKRFSRRALDNYAQYWAESAKLPSIAPETIARRFCISEGRHHLDDAMVRGRGLVVALPHVGSWEWGGAYLSQIGMSMTAVAEALEPPALFEWFRAKREAIGIHIEPLDEHAGTVLLQKLRDGGVVGLLCDRDIQGNGVEVEFFGERVTMPAGPATLALRTGATIVTAACYAGPGLDHHAVILAPIPAQREGRLREDVQRVTQLIARDLEGLIQRAPEQWHVLERRFART